MSWMTGLLGGAGLKSLLGAAGGGLLGGVFGGAGSLMGGAAGAKMFGKGGKNPLSGLGNLANFLPSEGQQVDPIAQRAQLDAIERMRGNMNQNMNASEIANMNLGINAANKNTAARSNALKQEALARGVGGAGLDYALRSNEEQQGVNAANEAGTNAASMANARALDSVAQLANLGSNMSDQAFNRNQASDMMRQFLMSQNQQNNQFRSNMANTRRGQDLQLFGAALGAGGAVAGRA
jgi:hypothetical protein